MFSHEQTKCPPVNPFLVSGRARGKAVKDKGAKGRREWGTLEAIKAQHRRNRKRKEKNDWRHKGAGGKGAHKLCEGAQTVF